MIMLNNVSVSLHKGGITERIRAVMNANNSMHGLTLKEITLWIGSGESWGIISDNNIQASAFIKTIAGIVKPLSGSVKAEGKIACAFFEENNLILTETGEQNCILLAKLKGFSEIETKAYVKSVLEQSLLNDYYKMPARKYNHEMRARLLMSMALCANPDILLIDNVLEHCGVMHTQRYISLIKAHCKLGMTVITKCSSNEILERLAGGAIWIKNGSLYKLGDFDTLNREYSSPALLNRKLFKERAAAWLNAQDTAFSSELSIKLPAANKKIDIQQGQADEQVIKLRKVLCEYIKANAEFSRQNDILKNMLKNEQKRTMIAEQKLRETIILSSETLKLIHNRCSKRDAKRNEE